MRDHFASFVVMLKVLNDSISVFDKMFNDLVMDFSS